MSSPAESALPPVLLGLLWFFSLFWAALVFVILGAAGNIAGFWVYEHLTSLGLASQKNNQDAVIVVTNTRLVCTSVGLLALPLVDRAWTSRLVLVRRRFADLKALAAACIALSYYLLVVVKINFIVPGEVINYAHGGSMWLYTVFAIGTVVAAPVAEEVFFRGWMWGRIEAASNPSRAALLSAAGWLACHLPNIAHALLLLPLACVVTFLRLRTGRLSPGLLLHMLNNAFAVWYFISFK